MQKQQYWPNNISEENIESLSTMGLEHPEGVISRKGRDWTKIQVCRKDTFSLVSLEAFFDESDDISYTKQEDYVKISFWLSGRHTTILDGFGQHEHDCPEVYITSGPQDMLKVDVFKRRTPIAAIGLCLRRDFFSMHLDTDPEDLPEPLRAIVLPTATPFAFHRFPLTVDFAAAARAILSVPSAVRGNASYGQAKCIELLCLLIDLMTLGSPIHRTTFRGRALQESSLHKAREMIAQRYSEAITLEIISKEVGLNRRSLTSGFRDLFGMSVYDYLQKERMQRAYELLHDEGNSVARVAEAVGFSHSCNFSTTFHSYFGRTPRSCRGRQR